VGRVEIRKFSAEELEKVCEIAEESARKLLLSEIPSSRIEDIDMTVDVEEADGLRVDVDLQVILKEGVQVPDLESLVKKSVDRAQSSVEQFLRGL